MTDEQYEEIRTRAAEAKLFHGKVVVDVQWDWEGERMDWNEPYGTRLLISPGAYADLRNRIQRDRRWDP